MRQVFEVLAGKYESGVYSDEENTKYAHGFDNLDDALAALDSVNDYPWSRIEYNGWILEGYKL